MTTVEVRAGTSPVILGLPHTGTQVPPAIAARLNHNGRLLADTDWHVEHLYDGLLSGVSSVRTTFHRYVVDANRDPAGANLYPGQNTTELVPRTDFGGVPIWREGEEPGDADVAERVAAFHRPYHAALEAEVERVRALHGFAVLYDCHSIRSTIPFLFDGVLPDFNIGTDGGRTCAPAIQTAAVEVCSSARGHTWVLNGRFRGGWTTRHYGQPARGIHAIQMELAQSTYLATEAPPFALDLAKAGDLRLVLATLLTRIEALASTLKG